MKYGHFDDERREYVIETPRTPRPWINYLGQDRFFGLISNTGGGYCFYRDALLRRITRYRYNNVPTDAGGRYFYIVDGDRTWTPGWMPMKPDLDSYECRHGMGYSVITSELGGLRVEMTFFVPLGADVEVQKVQLTNVSGQPKRIKLFSFIEWCLWNALDDFTNFQRNYSTGEVEVVPSLEPDEFSVIYHKTEYRERRNHFAYYAVNREIQGFDTDRESFLGTHNGFHEPEAVLEGRSRNSVASGWSPIASHYLEVELAPQASDTLVFLLGYAENDPGEKFSGPHVVNKAAAREVMNRFSSDAQVDHALTELKTYWSDLLSRCQIECTDARLQRMVNTWNPYQCLRTHHFSRSASYFESGIGRGMGFRDSNQDLLGVVHMIPEQARERILDIAATQLRDGGAYHQYQPLTKRGNTGVGGNFNDDPLWLILGVCAYIKEAGDTDILKQPVDYENDPALAAPLLDHLWRSFRFTSGNLGPHGLPLIGRADWNDCLNLNCFSTDPDESFQTAGIPDGRNAESVMIAGLFAAAGDEFAALLRFVGQESEASEVDGEVHKMRATVDRHGRDDAWFLRAYDDAGRKVGSQECEEGKIFIESQGWCVMGKMGWDDGFARRALDSVKEHLDTEHGIVLVQPPFQEYHVELGEVSSYPPGYKENAGIFCHNNPWIIIGECLLGNADAAFEYYRKICPAYREDISDVHGTEPYVYSQMIAGRDAVRHGEAKNSWLTGTAAWNYVAVMQHILGIRPDYAGLEISPCLPDGFGSITVTRVFRDIAYNIQIRQTKPGEDLGMWVSGKKIEGHVVPHGDAEEPTVHVEVRL